MVAGKNDGGEDYRQKNMILEMKCREKAGLIL